MYRTTHKQTNKTFSKETTSTALLLIDKKKINTFLYFLFILLKIVRIKSKYVFQKFLLN